MTIEAGLWAAEAGDTVVVEPCILDPYSYQGPLRVSRKRDVRVLAESAPALASDGEGLAVAVVVDGGGVSGGCLEVVDSESIEVTGFRFRGCDGHGVWVQRSVDVRIQSNWIEEVGELAVSGDDCQGITLVDNVIDAPEAGIDLVACDYRHVARNHVDGVVAAPEGWLGRDEGLLADATGSPDGEVIIARDISLLGSLGVGEVYSNDVPLSVNGAVRGRSIEIAGFGEVINAVGEWTGDRTNLAGPPGPAGQACWDLNGDSLCDLGSEDVDGDLECSIADCAGPPGADGAPGEDGAPGADGSPGVACWDLNADSQCDTVTEDSTGDGLCNVLDCAGPAGTPGVPCWDLNTNQDCDLLTEDQNDDGFCNVLDCEGPRGEDGVPGPPGTSLWTDGQDLVTTQASVGIGVASPAASHEVACPSGFVSIVRASNQLGCMQADEEGVSAWEDAATDCFSTYGGRLPSNGEWFVAMEHFNLSNEIDDWEWTDNTGASTNSHIVIGNGTTTTHTGESDSAQRAYRCWLPR